MIITIPNHLPYGHLCFYIHIKVPISPYRPRAVRSSGTGSGSAEGDTTENSTSIKHLGFFYTVTGSCIAFDSYMVSVFYDQSAHWGTVGDALPSLGYAVTGGGGRRRGRSEAVDLVALEPAMAMAATAAVGILGIRPRCRGCMLLLDHLRFPHEILRCPHNLPFN